MTRLFLLGTLLACSALAATPDTPQIDAAVVVGKAVIPLSVMHRFAEISSALPKPGELPVEDTHDKQHDSHTYCYHFGEERLEFFDSDFGVHTARLTRSKTKNDKCTAVTSQPAFEVGGRRFSLSAKKLPPLSGFTEEKKEQLVVLKRSWTYRADERQCFYREVSVEAKPGPAGFDSITVMNWEESGC